MFDIKFTSKFKKDFKRLKKQGKDLSKLSDVLVKLSTGESLPESMHDHLLQGNYAGHRECHIEPDWLLIYLIREEELVLTAVRSGSHSELLGL